MSLSSFANASWLKQLPAHAYDQSIIEYYPFTPSTPWLTSVDTFTQQKALETWFLHRFCSPKNRLPYDKKRRQYIFFNGGPFSAEYELVSKFHLVVSEDVIMQAVSELEATGDKLWILRTVATLESSFGKCAVVEPLAPFQQKLSELYRMIEQLDRPCDKLLEVVYFEAIRNFELFCVELALSSANKSVRVAERLMKMLLVSHNETNRIHLSATPDETVLNLLRQRLLVMPWYHWPTFVYLFKEGLSMNVSSLANAFGRVYSGHYRCKFGYSPQLTDKYSTFTPQKLHQLKLSLLRLAQTLHELSAVERPKQSLTGH